LWQYAANEGKVSQDTKDLFVHASASLSVLIAFFLGVQFGQAAGKRTDAMAIMVQLDGAKYFLEKRGIWISRDTGYHPFYFMDPAFASESTSLETQIKATHKDDTDTIQKLEAEIKIRTQLEGLSTEFPNFDAFSYFDGLAGLLGKLHALAHVHTETNTFNRLFRGIVLIAYGVAIPLGSTILSAAGPINGFTKWQFYVTILVNILILIVYFSIDYSQTHSVKRLADLASVSNYWRLADDDWIPRKDLKDETTTSFTEVAKDRIKEYTLQKRAESRLHVRRFERTNNRLKVN